MIYRKILLPLLFTCVCAVQAFSQDTTIIQTLSFDDITKRRDVFTFPDEDKSFRKILMKYTLKCDPRTTADGYNCGEWDYLTYNQLYDHDATYDSTYRDHPSFTVNGGTRQELRYTTQAGQEFYSEELTGISHDNVISLETYTAGGGAQQSAFPIKSSATGQRSVVMFTKSELADAGLTPGLISGMQLSVSGLSANTEQLVQIDLGTTKSVAAQLVELQTVDFTNVYRYITPFASVGMLEFQFHTPFLWDGTENLLIALSTEPSASNESIEFDGEITGGRALTTEEEQYALDFRSDGSFVNLGSGPQISGGGPRTIECWAYTRAFNTGGLFQAGPTGSTGRDFSLRTMGTDDRWRVQLWGAGDFDVTLPGSKNAWHHYAVVYDGITARMYYDGQLIQTNEVNLNTAEHDIWIGRWSGNYFDGMIDEVRIWDVALTSNELKRWMSKKLDATHVNYDHLVGYYDFNEGQGTEVTDQSSQAHENGTFSRLPWWTSMRGSHQMTDYQAVSFRPQIFLERGEYQSTILSHTYIDSLPARPVLLTIFNNPAEGKIVADDAPNHPSIATDFEIVWDADQWNYVYDVATGMRIDSSSRNPEVVLTNDTKIWYSPTVVYELGRFITPYGINLDLGPEGFTWYYDVTDYSALLRGDVELSAGNQQELIDLQFIFIEGTPPRDVKHIKQVWGPRGSYRYRDLDNDTRFPEVQLPRHTEARQYKIKTRISGHGHNSNDGSYPHCCEWKDNTHYLYVDGVQAADWRIFQYTECALNPVYPQGGTWPGAREGWCPGDVVKDFEFELTHLVAGDEISLDYDITDVPLTNLGMGNGNYVMSMHLVQYGSNNHDVDLELVDIRSPNNKQYYSRFNPSCSSPEIVVRNNGNIAITSATFEYWIKGGQKEQYQWSGSIDPHDETVIELPIGDGSLWSGDYDEPRFFVELSQPNGLTDLYTENNSASTSFELPDVYDFPLGLTLQTNARPFDNTLWIRDHSGNPVLELKNLIANQVYTVPLDYPEGCYTLDLIDTGNDGLSYWAFPAQGTGVLLLTNRNNMSVVKSFETEFGRRVQYAFAIGSITDVEEPILADDGFRVYPNPAGDFVTIELNHSMEDAHITIRNAYGQSVRSWQLDRLSTYRMYTGDLPGGSYWMEVASNDKHFAIPVILQH